MVNRNRLFLYFSVLALAVAATGCSQYGAFDVMDSLSGGAPAGVWSRQVGGLTAQPDHRRLTISWQDPASSVLDHISLTMTPGNREFAIDPGVQTVEVGQLENGTSYSVQVTPVSTTGAAGVTTEITAVPSVGPLPNDAWVDARIPKRRRIVINNESQDSDLLQFPLLVILDASSIDYAETNGNDLRFFDEGNQSELYYELESWDPAGSSFIWVRVPEVEGGHPQDYIWMYWGSGETTPYQNPGAVWSEYELVYHFSDNLSGGVTDSSPHGRDGVVVGSPSVVPGQIGSGLRLGAGDNYVELGQADLNDLKQTPPSEYTVEVFARGDSAPALASPNGPLMAQSFYNIGWNHNSAPFVGSFHLKDSLRGWSPASFDSLAGDTWYHLAGTFAGDRGTAVSYVNGSSRSVISNLGTTPVTDVTYLRLGTDGAAGDVFQGVVDELRIVHAARSQDWIAAQYLSMTGQMISYGPEEDRP